MVVVDPVKARRPYRSPKHAELRRRTRRDVVAAAQRLFGERGYVHTTIENIAVEAGVAVQTVYAAFGNKRAILRALLDTTVSGDDEPVSVIHRITDDVNRAPDPSARLGRAMRFGRRLVERSADVNRIMRSAATVDADIRAGLTEADARRYLDARSIIDLVADERTARRTRQRAADVLFVVHSHEVYDLLVGTRGWSAQRWEQWAQDNVARELAQDMDTQARRHA